MRRCSLIQIFTYGELQAQWIPEGFQPFPIHADDLHVDPVGDDEPVLWWEWPLRGIALVIMLAFNAVVAGLRLGEAAIMAIAEGMGRLLRVIFAPLARLLVLIGRLLWLPVVLGRGVTALVFGITTLGVRAGAVLWRLLRAPLRVVWRWLAFVTGALGAACAWIGTLVSRAIAVPIRWLGRLLRPVADAFLWASRVAWRILAGLGRVLSWPFRFVYRTVVRPLMAWSARQWRSLVAWSRAVWRRTATRSRRLLGLPSRDGRHTR